MKKEQIVKGKELEIFKRMTLCDFFYVPPIINPETPALCYRPHDEGPFIEVTYREFAREVKALSLGLMHLGLQKGDKVSIIADTRYEWGIVDFAIITVGGVTVTIYPTLSPRSVEYIINDSDSKIIFVENSEQLDKITGIRDSLPELKYVITMEPIEKPFADIYTIEEVKSLGQNVSPEEYEEVQLKIHPDDLCSIVYSSGTTGQPKGVMLSHWNWVSNIFALKEIISYEVGDKILVFLPLAHVYMRIAFFAAIAGRQTCYFVRPDQLSLALPEVRPEGITAVPRLWERIYERMLERVEASRITRRIIFYWSAEIARRMGELKSKKLEPPLELKIKHHIADRVVFKRIRSMAGLDRLKLCISAGSALSKDIAYFFSGLGIPILEGYGLTETAAPTNVNPLNDIRPGYVGPPLPGIMQKISEDGEILVKGDCVMKGYYKLPSETEESFTEDGWLKTGDLGEFHKDDYLLFKERKKNIIVLSTGKNVAPLPIEDKLKENPWIEEAVVTGDDQRFISAIILPHYKKLIEFARENNIPFDDGLTEYIVDMSGEELPNKVDPGLLRDKKVMSIYKKAVDDVNRFFESFEQVKKYILINEAITIESGELTPTYKVKRNVMENKYADQLKTLYG